LTPKSLTLLRWIRICQIILFTALCAVLLLNSGAYWRNGQLPQPFRPVAGHAYTAVPVVKIPLRPLLYTPTSGVGKQPARLQVLENGVPLAGGETPGDAIIQRGAGGYVYWEGTVTFSASDNSNPNEEGRVYRWALAAALALALAAGLTSPLGGIGPWGFRNAAARLLRPIPRMPAPLYWVGFTAILTAGTALRLFWTHVLHVPYVSPDSLSYVTPVIAHGWLPFSEIRTGGTSTLILLGLSLFRGPVGILLMHNVTVIASAVFLCLAIRHVLRFDVLSLLILIFLLFNKSNITYEYFLMSEIDSAVFYCLYAGLALLSFRHKTSLTLAVAIGVVAFLNIYVKPSALVLIPATVILYGLHGWTSRDAALRRTALAGCLAVGAIIIGLGAMMTGFKARYGEYQISRFDGYNMFSHVGHLTDLDGPAHPELKKTLRPLMERYRERYVALGRHEPNWLVFGSLNEQLTRDFDGSSPAKVMIEYLRSKNIVMTIASSNAIYKDLAVEGIKAHPVEYLRLVAHSFVQLFRHGYGFTVHRYIPAPDALEEHRRSFAQFRTILLSEAGKPEAVSCQDGRDATASARWPLRLFVDSIVLGCEAPVYEAPATLALTERVHGAFRRVAEPLGVLVQELPMLAVLGLLACCIPGGGSPRQRDTALMAAFFGLCCLGYCVLLAFLNIADPPRFMININVLLALTGGLAVMAGLLRLANALRRGGAHLFDLPPSPA
jgi:hypothetical protein